MVPLSESARNSAGEGQGSKNEREAGHNFLSNGK
jgi:hypothetical protein